MMLEDSNSSGASTNAPVGTRTVEDFSGSPIAIGSSNQNTLPLG